MNLHLSPKKREDDLHQDPRRSEVEGPDVRKVLPSTKLVVSLLDVTLIQCHLDPLDVWFVTLKHTRKDHDTKNTHKHLVLPHRFFSL